MTGETMRADPEASPRSPRVHDHRAAAEAKPWVCRHCKRRFRRAEHLEQHKRDRGCER